MLKICDDLFVLLNKQEIKYCHWKSNSHLDKALSGKTDLDLLVERDNASEFKDGLRKLDFKEILSPADKRFPGLYDYLGFDQESGRLAHLHVHYNLVLGQKYIKNHHLPIEKYFLANTRLKYNVYIPSAEIELALLVIRAHMKVDSLSLIKHFIRNLQGKIYTPFPSDIENEFAELIAESEQAVLDKVIKDIGLPIDPGLFSAFIDKFTDNKLSVFNVISYRTAIITALKGYRRETGLKTVLNYYKHALKENRLLRCVLSSKKKTMPAGGISISLVGADGSGKSSHVKDLTKWLSWKLSVKNHYYGIPKSNSLMLYSYLIRFVRKLHLSSLALWFQNVLWLYLSWSRYKLSKTIHSEKVGGSVVISDRFPLESFYSMSEPMDGPRIKYNGAGVNKYMADLERENYNRIAKPDRIYVLKVALEELRNRKNDLDYETHKKKAEAVNSIVKTDTVEIIDANLPYDEIQLILKAKIWASL
ncbi:MAG: hypothetical protein KZQ76_01520 [Candidatus Thiodiazotropha sp. (ex Epidulcina cf. delphinae)]|nr:hypothetical protein [Candidatus Thiodiazotropha sp. (ex Epidulcina cf. delphinae)]